MVGVGILQGKQIMKMNEPFRDDFSTKNENNFLCILQNINLVSVGRSIVCMCQDRVDVIVGFCFFLLGDIRQV